MDEKNRKLKVTSCNVLGKLPDLFTFKNGSKVTDAQSWEKRKAEFVKDVIDLQYGTMPPSPDFVEVEKLYEGKNHISYKIHTGRRGKPISFMMKVIRPDTQEKFPVIIDGDLCFNYAFNDSFINTPLSEGIGWALFDRTELAHDICGEGRQRGALYDCYPNYTFGALGAWAWGYSRCLDALLQTGLINPDCVVFTGHSRGGKTAMLAGALDSRACIVNPNATCAGSASCYRIHMTADVNGEKRSETLKDLLEQFPFWMGEGMQKYASDENSLPFDAHFIKAMVAPRTLFLSESAEDIWSNPIGSYLTTTEAKKLYEFLGAGDNLYWYFRNGKHYHDLRDLQMLVNLILHKTRGEALSDDFFNVPFDVPDII